jgi:hypothetical protein
MWLCPHRRSDQTSVRHAALQQLPLDKNPYGAKIGVAAFAAFWTFPP